MLRPLTLTLIASLTLPGAAVAQFGNLTKKAKEKAAAEAAKAVGAKPAEGTLKFDNTMLELTTPVLDRMVVGLRARASQKGSNGRTAAELRRRAQELSDEAENLNRDKSNERFEYNNKLGAAENCMSEVHAGLRKEHVDALQRRFMSMTGANLQGSQSANAKFMAEYQRVATEMASAAAAGDTARGRKAEADYNKLVGIDPKADSVKARAQCSVPPAPPWMTRADAASAESNQLYNEARDVEAKGNAAGATASGMTAEQFAMALERITGFLAGNGSLKYSPAEQKALSAQRSQLQGLAS
jgi:hypothetical protein